MDGDAVFVTVYGVPEGSTEEKITSVEPSGKSWKPSGKTASTRSPTTSGCWA